MPLTTSFGEVKGKMYKVPVNSDKIVVLDLKVNKKNVYPYRYL